MSKLENASVLAFERKLDPSDALFFAGNWADRKTSEAWPYVEVRTKSVRGTISNRLKAKDQDPAKLDAAIENSNLQTVDVATLPHDADTLKVRFTLRVLAGVGEPSACNKADYRAKLLATVAAYREAHGFGELAQRYAANLANGRYLWRNRIGAEQVEVHVEQLQDGKAVQGWTFDALALSLNELATGGKIAELGALIEDGLAGKAHVLLQITAFVRSGAGLEVFPSQELILDRGRGDKSKTLYFVAQKDRRIAAIHSQKIGNALRTIDTWYEDAAANGPIAIEPYGSVTTQGKAYRQPKQKLDFYTLLDNWVLKNVAPAAEQQHFVIATLIRGGVFGEAG
ncbi:type I-F CRISPR-associated protein Csy3 [Laribacter hongkongensis]|uniref:Type I-F CRISPR-associated protein Csy3 n=1 Tax=Laribacter hongkongensis TaxID=168471 RepID=A0ABD4SRN2_9NEIS|nr:type I-F CRISPR-associated protein Csy3 [Laribacter hongkongensis]MCG9026421.1 type I-F CRISPR-associated protein Csy3 [Laribacter hongkongensis]MCG9100242.1 type I-F CRISPR-associated protein Csy3 [Laribacter hongkongensis]MCG9103183.1 type I-F CRISPR-associated protein Csy3 [Laribacter hongkongensis]MCG9112063.1 type I-F CRISPR-associated protein Csy3 [Laribacter hongkongensis]MCG9119375.1 type I-F CRISPR-associated protein Csy3 [Laribacter hongkongensis]